MIPVIILSSMVVIRNINGDFRTTNLGKENMFTTTAYAKTFDDGLAINALLKHL